jgi:phospholipase C
MKSSMQKSLLALCRRAAGFTAVTAMLLAPIASTFADFQGHENDHHTGLQRLRHIIVIYQENWSFDSLYGQFPGASGYAYGFDTLPQLDLKASPPYSSLVYKTPPPLLGQPAAGHADKFHLQPLAARDANPAVSDLTTAFVFTD